MNLLYPEYVDEYFDFDLAVEFVFQFVVVVAVNGFVNVVVANDEVNFLAAEYDARVVD